MTHTHKLKFKDQSVQKIEWKQTDDQTDTIRYGTVYSALKSWRYGQLNLAHGTEAKNKEILKPKTE